MSPQMLSIWGGAGNIVGLEPLPRTKNMEVKKVKKEASTTHQVNRNEGRGRREAAGGGGRAAGSGKGQNCGNAAT